MVNLGGAGKWKPAIWMQTSALLTTSHTTCHHPRCHNKHDDGSNIYSEVTGKAWEGEVHRPQRRDGRWLCQEPSKGLPQESLEIPAEPSQTTFWTLKESVSWSTPERCKAQLPFWCAGVLTSQTQASGVSPHWGFEMHHLRSPPSLNDPTLSEPLLAYTAHLTTPFWFTLPFLLQSGESVPEESKNFF